MPADLLTRIDLDLLYPRFCELVIDIVAACRARGVDYWAIQGFRSMEEQLALYAKGRDVAGRVVDPSKVVTKVKSGAHNFGIGVDLARDVDLNKPGLQPTWKPADYTVLAEEAVKLGLEPGALWAGFPDYDHVQLNLAARGLSLSALRRLYQIHGLPAVFAELDKHQW